MRVQQYKIARSVEDGVREEKTCWLDRLNLRIGDSVTLDSCPDWMWWEIIEVYGTTAELEQVNYKRPERKSEELAFGWGPQC